MAKVGILQLCSTDSVEQNLNTVARIMQEHAEQDCQLWVLPESVAFLGHSMAQQADIAERKGRGPIQQALAELAMRHQTWLVAGTVPLREGEHIYASTLVFNPRGECAARYNKMHLFDVSLPDRDEAYCESAVFTHGDSICVLDTPLARLGVSVCYDLRFPELYRQQLERGAQVLVIPAAFTKATGEAHWHTLLRARAIENQCYVIASAQVGRHVNGRETYGHSLIYNPWGELLAELPMGEGAIVADIDLAELDRIRQHFPSINHRRL